MNTAALITVAGLQFCLKGFSAVNGVFIMQNLVSNAESDDDGYVYDLISKSHTVLWVIFAANTIDMFKDFVLRSPSLDNKLHHLTTYLVLVTPLMVDLRMTPYFAAISGTFEMVGPLYQMQYVMKHIPLRENSFWNHWLKLALKMMIVAVTLLVRVGFLLYVIGLTFNKLIDPNYGGSPLIGGVVIVGGLTFASLDLIWCNVLIRSIVKALC